MNCAEFQKQVQRRLDGDRGRDHTVVDPHLATCSECQSLDRATEQLLQGLSGLPVPFPPPEMASRLVRREVESHRRRAVYRRLTTAAVAAGLLGFAIVGYQLGWLSKGAPAPSESQMAKHETTPQSATSLRANVDDAVGAISGIFNQTAETALEPGRILFPNKASVAFLREATALERAPAPAVPSLRTAGQGVTEFAPVASFGRFFNYFAQEFPAMDAERKSGS